MIYYDIQQGSPEWFALRLGKVTGSCISDVTAKTKTGYGASRANYMAQLIAERLTGQVQESYFNTAMQWGKETEPQARITYEFLTNREVAQVAYADHPIITESGCSPDGLVSNDGLIEIKCPNTATHLDFLLSKTIPKKYIDQMQWQMACTERKWCDFVSFDPRLPIDLHMYKKRVERDDEYIKSLESEVNIFLEELHEKIAKLNEIQKAEHDLF